MIKLFCVGFPKDIDESALYTFFGDFGDVSEVKFITDQETGLSKGYAFVDFLDEVGANLAIKELDGTELSGRTLSVRLADKQPRVRKTVEVPFPQQSYQKVRHPSNKRHRRRSA
jgi:RNA recognition motif-containing protein